MTNWVDRRHQRQENLSRASELWQEAVHAIDECCKSYNKYYSDHAATLNKREESHIVVSVEGDNFPARTVKAIAQVEFNNAERSITSKVDRGQISFPEKKFVIEADETHAYITYQGRAISLDEFSRLAIELALYKQASV